MKRILFTVLAASLSLLFLSCGRGGEAQPSETTAPAEEPMPIKDTAHYQNPIIRVNDKNTWPDYGIGDPFVMRYNGRYYLYSSTKDGRIGIQCWTSDDLVDWHYEGLCAEEWLTMTAYAPEVVYYNGDFYMYTSPAGRGHYVLKSESPTGPFVAVTDNFGLSIDGDVFIDDDGSWHFYSAAVNAIMAFPMSAPDKVEAERGIKIPCDLHGWTEGSMIIKHDGVYYLTYTGNHVWSAGYRIHYATSTKSPTKFTPAKNNPLLLSTNEATVKGIGHSSTVLGPNLDEYYIVYHSHKIVPQRSMNIDRIFFNGGGTVVLGPSTTKQDAPKMPDVYSRFEAEDDLVGWTVKDGTLAESGFVLTEGGSALSEHTFSADFTAEYNLKSLTDKAGILFGYTDEKNFGKAIYDAEKEELTVTFTADGKETVKTCPIRASFSDKMRADALILFTVQKSDAEYTFFVNRREVLQCKNSLSGGAIGVLCESGEAVIGFVGATGGALQSTFGDVYKPAESVIPAITCVTKAEKTVHDGVNFLSMQGGERYTYKVNVSENGTYDLVVEYRAEQDCTVEIYQGSTLFGTLSLPASDKTMRTVVRRLTLASGIGTVSLCPDKNAELLNLSFHKAEATPEKAYTLGSGAYRDGTWILADGALVLKSDFGKFMVGSEDWGDYTAEAEITPTSDNINVGLCVRVSNPATVEKSNNSLAGGTDFLQGYFIGLSKNSIVLGKHNYDWKELARAPFTIQKDQTYKITVVAKQNTLQISINGELVLEYEDTDAPFLHGMIGFRAHKATLRVNSLKISPIE